MAWNDPQPDFGMGYQPSNLYTREQGWQTAPGGGYTTGSGSWQQYQKAFNPAEFDRFNQYKAQQEKIYQSPYASAERMASNTSNRLAELLTDPSKIQTDPGYQFVKQQGEQAINRSAAAKGMLNSGGVLAELQKYGSGLASQEYGGQVNRLADLMRGSQQFLLGANSGPYTYASLNPYSGSDVARKQYSFV